MSAYNQVIDDFSDMNSINIDVGSINLNESNSPSKIYSKGGPSLPSSHQKQVSLSRTDSSVKYLSAQQLLTEGSLNGSTKKLP